MSGYQAIAIDGFICGNTKKDGDIYIGRAFFNKEWVPAKLLPSKEKICICFKRKEYQLAGITRIQKLIGNPTDYKWVKYNGEFAAFPIDAIPVDKNYNNYYIGRIVNHDKIEPGRIENYVLFYGINGRQQACLENYEVLCYGDNLISKWHDLSFVNYQFP